MPKEVDKRNMAAFAGFEDGLTNMNINPWTGQPRTFKMESPLHLPGDLVDKAVNFLRQHTGSFGFESSSAMDFVADANVSETSTGEKTVHVQQVYKGIPVFLVNKAIVFNRDGGIETAVGDSVNITANIDIEPTVNVLQAAEVVVKAILADDEDDHYEEENAWSGTAVSHDKPNGEFVARKLVEFTDLAPRPTVLDKSIFAENIRANLVIFYIGPEALLAWYFVITLSEAGPQYDVVVSAGDASNIDVLYLKNSAQHAVAKGNVHKTNGADSRVFVEFPVARSEYPLPVNGTSIPFKEWVLNDETRGVNVVVRPAGSTTSFRGLLNGTTVLFDPANEKDQQLLNVFYFCNLMHDFFLLLGFDEKAGSFDGNDPLIAHAHAGSFAQTANMYTPIDGSSPVMNLGFVDSSGRHTALDCDVVFHEYVHGVTKRLAGGRVNIHALKEDQSRAMGEGWSDYFALTIQNFHNTQEKVTSGAWVKGNAAGVRTHPYNDGYPNHRTYGKIAHVRTEHARGEVWCATLMHWTRHLSAQLGKQLAYFVCWQSVVDSLKLVNANPSFLEARDAIVRAVGSLGSKGVIASDVQQAALNQLWSSFALFGMGVKAYSPGPSVQGIVEDFTTP